VRSFKLMLAVGVLVLAGLTAQAASAKIVKVLPHFLDREGRHSLSPSLYDRDAYQAQLRAHPQERSGLRFDVQWKAPKTSGHKLRLELRGFQGKNPTAAVVESTTTRRGLFSNWSAVPLTGEAYQKFGELRAWRATLWDGDRLVAETKSFLW
jgi:hypothetical protein